ncbi:hypothetical protein UlMin_023514 [Ulmus minor]
MVKLVEDGLLSPAQKKQLIVSALVKKMEQLKEEQSSEQSEEQDNDLEEEEEVADKQLEERKEGQENATKAITNASISVILADTQVLCCPICHSTLSLPVYQCENDHIVCSFCRYDCGFECISCCTSPVRYKRSKAIENIILSLHISCPNMKYGCKDILSFNDKRYHEANCQFAPCSCPFCNFIGSSKQLSSHVGDKHSESVKCFNYNCSFSIELGTSAKFTIFKEANDGDLYILAEDDVEGIGNIVSVSRLGPELPDRIFLYELKADNFGCSFRLKSTMDNVHSRADNPPPSKFLLIPSGLVSPSRRLKSTLRIWLKDI